MTPVIDGSFSVQAMRSEFEGLQDPGGPNENVRSLLERAGISDWESTSKCLRSMARDREAEAGILSILPQLLASLAATQHPNQVLCTFARFVLGVPDRAALFHILASSPRAVENLVTLFSSSQFLTEILLRNPEYFPLLLGQRDLARPKSAVDFYAGASAATEKAHSFDEKMDSLRRYQRRELLRIGASDLFDLWDLGTVTEQLSNLAEGIVRAGLDLAAEWAGTIPDGFVILALGKLGGRELNYSSDIDLIFLAEANASRYRRLGEKLIQILGNITSEGFLYRVDMRLRPWGVTGPLVSPLEGYVIYLRKHARLWEKQALLRARPVAGDVEVGREFLRRAEPIIFSHSGGSLRAGVHRMKERLEARLTRQGIHWGEVKLGQGSIRDVEFIAQYLQLLHGARYPDIRTGNTPEALNRLHARGILSTEEHRILSEGYVFLRTVEHHLQLMHYRQTHTLPDDAEGIASLARRLRFTGKDAGELFLSRYEQHRGAIRTIYRKYLEETKETHGSALSEGRPPHISEMPPAYAEIFTDEEMRRHALMTGSLGKEHPAEVEAVSLPAGRWRLTIVGYDYFGELSAICGLLLAHGFNILEGNVFTTEPGTASSPRRIVDVFLVTHVGGEIPDGTWQRYADDLRSILRLLDAGKRSEAQGELIKQVAASVGSAQPDETPLYPVEIEIDNESSEKYTVIRINSTDTVGFLYELTNALALNGIYISRVTVRSVGRRVEDTLYVTDTRGCKITSQEERGRLRTATVLVKHFTHLLPHAPNPEAALLHFSELLGQFFSRPRWPDELASLENPKILRGLARLLGISDFLWDDFLRMQYENLFPVVRNHEMLSSSKPKADLQSELENLLAAAPNRPERVRALNEFKDREMFRIDMRYIMGYSGAYWQFSVELSELAEVVVKSAYDLCYSELCDKHGKPILAGGRPSSMTVCALGKFGGREIGFASDIELMFVYRGDGATSGPGEITTAEFYDALVRCFLRTIHSRRKGIFEIDLRLRPYGQSGSLAVSLESFRKYFAPGGDAWPYERQGLVRLRPVAGDPNLGEEISRLRDAFVYTGEPSDVAAMQAMRERQIRHLVNGGTVNAKYSPGGLVDLEYLVQGLQITYGHRNRNLRVTNTRGAMLMLATVGILSPDELADLTKAHTFLRSLIEALRIVRGNAKDLTVPFPGSDEFGFLARRMGYGSRPEKLWEDLNRHMENVLTLRDELLKRQPVPKTAMKRHDRGSPNL